jgi:calcium-dependent protein kinase
MELCTGGNLQAALLNVKRNNFKVGNFVNRVENSPGLAEFVVKPIMRQLMSAVAHIHSRGICHRDIKLENIMIESREYGAQIKLIDFGLGTRFIGATPIKTPCGSPLTMAPEVHRKSYDERCDVWSAGVVCFWLLAGKNPFLAASPGGVAHVKTVITNVVLERYKYHRSDWKNVSMAGIEFTQNMLLYNYKHRWHAADALKDSWLTDEMAVSITDFYGVAMNSVKSEVGSDVEDDVDDSNAPSVRRTSISSVLSDKSTSGRSSSDSKVQHAVMNLKRQSQLSALEKTSKLAMAYTTSSSDHADLRAFFQLFDEDNNGTLSRTEFQKALMACNVFDPTSSEQLSKEDVDLIFEAVDLNKDGEITLTEFLAASLDPRDFDMHSINTAFQLLDMDNKGDVHIVLFESCV